MDSFLSTIITKYFHSNTENTCSHKISHPNIKSLNLNDDRDDVENFWIDYCELTYQEDVGEYYLTERVTEIVPIVIICDFRFNSTEDSGELYDENLLIVLTKIFQDTIISLFKIDDKCSELICCVLDSKENSYYDDGTESVQIRFQFPYCRVKKNLISELFIPAAIKNIQNYNVSTYTTQAPKNTWEQIITWYDFIPMYKSKIRPHDKPLILRHIYKQIQDVEDEPEECSLHECFIMDLHTHITTNLARKDTLLAANDDPEYWIPMLLSLNYGTNITLPLNKPITIRGLSNSNYSLENRTSNNDAPEDIVNDLLNLLHPKRFIQNNYRTEIGKALYNTFNGEEAGLIIWKKFTQQHTDDSECEYYYRGFSQGNCLTYKTIAWYAREDNPTAYKHWHDNWCINDIQKSLSCSHEDVAQAFYKVFWLEFACKSTVNSGDWYHFTNHRWISVDNGSDLRHAISKFFVKRYEEFRQFIIAKGAETQDEAMKDKYEGVIKKIGNLISKLKDMKYKGHIVRAAADIFFQQDRDFGSKLDTNDCILGMRNCVIETTSDKAIPRVGKPEDYVSCSTGTSYSWTYTWNHPDVQKVLHWYKQTYITQETRHYKMKLDASCLRGRNADKIFPVCSGDVNNSKSMWKKLFDAAYGPYSVDFPMSILSGNRSNSSGPTPELAQARCARIAWLCEPDDGENFRNGILKMLTGGDSFFARYCRENGGKIEAMFKLFLVCNQIPLIPNCDQAVKERFINIPFLTTWVKPHLAPRTEAEQFEKRTFPQDKFFDKTIPYLASAFMWISVQMYEKYCDEGLIPPQEVIDHTEKYWNENDVFLLFSNECIEKVYVDAEKTAIDTRHVTSLQDIQNEFTRWYKDTYPGMKVPDRKTLKKELSLRWKCKPDRNNCWSGVQIRAAIPNI